MAERVYTYDHVDAALCIWEEIVSPMLEDAPQPWTSFREEWGTANLRHVVVTELAWPCHEAWMRALERYHAAEDEEHDDTCEAGGGTGVCTCGAAARGDPGSFDWEFIPFWIRECVDWSGEHPRVRGRAAGGVLSHG